jgi:hypothetical protein
MFALCSSSVANNSSVAEVCAYEIFAILSTSSSIFENKSATYSILPNSSTM